MADNLDKDEIKAKLCEQLGIDLSPEPHWLDELSDVLLTISFSLVIGYIFVMVIELIAPDFASNFAQILNAAYGGAQPSNPSAFG